MKIKFKKMTTIQLVNALLHESKEVKSSVGGDKDFRAVCDFVNAYSTKYFQDDVNCEEVRRSTVEIAKMTEDKFDENTLNEVKKVYSL